MAKTTQVVYVWPLGIHGEMLYHVTVITNAHPPFWWIDDRMQ